METGEPPASFGEWLKCRRRALDLTQTELAQRAGCSVAGLRKIETGERRPSKQLATLLAEALDIAPDRRATFVRVARGESRPDRLGSITTPAPAVLSFPASLPAWPTPFIGRSGEMAALGELLLDRECRLLTLIGPGGMGKTRLAVEVAAQVSGRFGEGVCFVALAQQSSPAFLVPALADALGFSFQGQVDARAQLLNHLRDRRLLLVLDNMEHLLAGVDLVAEIASHAPGLKMLATSRERLNILGEWVYELEGLPVPAGSATAGIESYGSIALFVQNAHRARAGFALRETDWPCIVRICRLLEGTPLGIEMAAAWIVALSPCDIADQIEKSFDFLVTPLRNTPERQRSLRAAFEHSWRLLSDEERRALGRLAVFQGGFDHHAAEQVAQASLVTLLALVSKSLVRRRESGRFDLHEVVRQFALTHLAEDAGDEATRDKHSEYYLTLLRNRERDLKGPAQRAALDQLTEEIGNIRAGWAWAVTSEHFDLIGAALRSYGWMCEVGGRLQEGVAEIGLVVWALSDRELSDEEKAALGQAKAQQGLLNFRLGRLDQAVALFEESLTLLRPLGDPALLVDPLVLSSIILHLSGDYARSLERLREGGACARVSGNDWFHIYAHYNLGYVTALTGRYEEGYTLMVHSLNAWRATSDPRSISLGLNFLAPAAIRLGHFEQARSWLEESIDLTSELGDRWGLGMAYRHLGLVALAQGHIDEARGYLNSGLDVIQGFVTGYDLVMVSYYLGQCAAAEGDDAQAERLFLDAIDEAMASRIEALVLQILTDLAELQLRHRCPEQALSLAATVLAHPAATHETVTRAAELRQAAAEHLDDARRAGIETSAPEHSLAETVRLLRSS